MDNDGRIVLIPTATNNRNPEIVKTLINAGVIVNTKDNIGSTALIRAARERDVCAVLTCLRGGSVHHSYTGVI